MAAYCAIIVGNATGGNYEADLVRSQITDFAKWIIHEYLTELRPRLWAHTALGFDNNLQVRCTNRFTASGEADALRIIRTVFHRDVVNGNRNMFTDNGPICQPA